MNLVSEENGKGFAALCYHYFRFNNSDPFPRILGTRQNEFLDHLNEFKGRYHFLSLGQVDGFTQSKYSLSGDKPSLLLTFDDGLSDHYWAAEQLYELGISGTFFVPSCIFKDKEPANPIIIHYCIAEFGIVNFLKAYKNELVGMSLDQNLFNIDFVRGRDDPWEVIGKIKTTFKYLLPGPVSRSILLNIYRKTFLAKYPNAMEIMHLTEQQIHKMVQMGHSLGAHTHSHISIAASKLSKEFFEQEVLAPKSDLEKFFKTKVLAMSYPYGEEEDCMTGRELLGRGSKYRLAFTIRKHLNSQSTPPLELGRYSPVSKESTAELLNALDRLRFN